MSQKLTTEEFIKKAREVHGDKYDYSKVEYVNNSTPVVIVCQNMALLSKAPITILMVMAVLSVLVLLNLHDKQ